MILRLLTLLHTCSFESFSLRLLLTRTFFRSRSFFHSRSNSTMDLLQSSVSWYTCSLDFSNSASKMLNSEENQLVSFSITSTAIFVSSSDYSRFVFKLQQSDHWLVKIWRILHIDWLHWAMLGITAIHKNRQHRRGYRRGKNMATINCRVTIVSFALLFIFPTNALDNGLALTPPSK